MRNVVGRFDRFSTAATVMLALAFAAATTVYAVAHSILLSPPRDVTDPGRLLRVMIIAEPRNGVSFPMAPVVSYPEFQAFERSGVARFAAYTVRPVQAATAAGWRTLRLGIVSDQFFAVVGRSALRDARAGDAESAGAIVSADLARDIDRARASRSIRINGSDIPIGGVAARHFTGVDQNPVDAWIPATSARDAGLIPLLGEPNQKMWTLIARPLDDGESIDALRQKVTAALRAVDQRLGVADPRRIWLASINDDQYATSSTPRTALVGGFYVLVGAIVVVAWISAILLLAMRVLATETHLAIRLALGASPASLIRGIVLESAKVQTAALACAAVVVLGALEFARAAYPDVDWRFDMLAVIGFGAAMALAGTLIAAIPAAAMTLRVHAIATLNGKGTVAQMSRTARLSSFMLLALQCGLSVALVAIAGRVLSAVAAANAISFGYATEGAYVIRADILADPSLAGATQAAALQRAVAKWPSVRSTAWAQTAPLLSSSQETHFLPEGRQITTNVNRVQPTFFDALSIRFVQGRGFTSSDGEREANSVILDTVAVRELGLSRSPVGACLRLTAETDRCSVVVGVVDGVRAVGLWSEPQATIYYPQSEPAPDLARVLIVRVDSRAVDAAGHLALAIRAAGLDPTRFAIESLAAKRSAQTNRWRRALAIALAAAVLTLILGTWGQALLIAFDVRRRRREIGLRSALGAPAARLVIGAARMPLASSATGVSVGVAAGVVLNRQIAPWIGSVPAGQTPSYTAAAILCAVTVVLASALGPALAASRVPPLVALEE